MAAFDHIHSLEITLSGPRRRRRRDQKRNLLGGLAVLALGGLVADLERQPTPSVLAVAPAALAFAPQPIDSASAPQAVTISNPGAAPVAIGDLTLANAANFSYELRDCPDGTVQPYRTCVVLVTFHPQQAVDASGSLRHDATGQTVSLRGTGRSSALVAPVVPAVAPAGPPVPPEPASRPAPAPAPAPPPAPPLVRRADLAPDRALFGEVELESERSQRFVLRNTGQATLTDVRLRLDGDHLTDFRLDGSVCPSLAPGAECPSEVFFVPHEEGAHEATLLATSGEQVLDRVTLNGLGEAKPQAQAEISPNPVAFSQTVRDATITISNVGRAPLDIRSITINDTRNFDVRPQECLRASPLGRGESCRVQVRFKGRSSAQGMLTVKHSDPNMSSNVLLAAEQTKRAMSNWVKGLLIGGAITAAVATAAMQGKSSDGDQPPPPQTEPAPAETAPPSPNNTAPR